MMLIFFHAARLSMITFNPYLGSKPLAEALMQAPPGKLIEADAYYAFSSVFFYANRQALLWNGRRENLEYGSYAPGAPAVFIGDTVTAEATVIEARADKPITRLRCVARRDDGTVVLEGECLVYTMQAG